MTNYIQHSQFGTNEQVQEIAAFLLSKEQYIIDTYPFVSYFGTDDPTLDTPGNLVTTRSGTYNVFQFVNECPVLETLKTFLVAEYKNYLITKNYMNYVVNPAINCWVNVIREGESIRYHKHSGHEMSFVSGTMVLQAEATNTWYKFDDGELMRVPNVPGKVSIFPCNVLHWTDMHYGNNPRVTLGFDFMFDRETSLSNPVFYSALVPIELP